MDDFEVKFSKYNQALFENKNFEGWLILKCKPKLRPNCISYLFYSPDIACYAPKSKEYEVVED